MNGPHGSRVRLDLSEAFRPDHFQTRDSIGGASLKQRLEPGNLRGAGCYDNLAAAVQRHAVVFAERLHPPDAFHTQTSLVRAGLVIDPGMDDAAVVSGL